MVPLVINGTVFGGSCLGEWAICIDLPLYMDSILFIPLLLVASFPGIIICIIYGLVRDKNKEFFDKYINKGLINGFIVGIVLSLTSLICYLNISLPNNIEFGQDGDFCAFPSIFGGFFTILFLRDFARAVGILFSSLLLNIVVLTILGGILAGVCGKIKNKKSASKK